MTERSLNVSNVSIALLSKYSPTFGAPQYMGMVRETKQSISFSVIQLVRLPFSITIEYWNGYSRGRLHGISGGDMYLVTGRSPI